MKRLFYLFILLYFNSLQLSFGQSGIRDSSIQFPFFGFSYGMYQPDGDLANRFGITSQLTCDALFKTKKNFVYGLSGGFIFGDKVKEPNLLSAISTGSGQVIGLDGLYADIRIFERGYQIAASFGKIFTFKKPNPNSGFIVLGGPGFIQHKIRFEPIGNTVPGLTKEYRKGYDHLTNGLELHEFLGYILFGNRQLVNFYGGFEFIQGFTANRRKYNFDNPDLKDDNRLDLMYGFKLGWVLPLYKKKPAKYYLY